MIPGIIRRAEWEFVSVRVNTMEQNKTKKGEGFLTPPMMMTIINPGAIIISALAPTILGIFLAAEKLGRLPFIMTVVVIAIPALFNASVNLLNDYFDYIRGNDTKDNIADAADAPLAYYQIQDPKPVLRLGVFCLTAGIILGLYVIWQSGPIPLIIGAIGVLAVLAYSAGKLPISHYPVGELFAGFVMGGLIPLGVYSAFTGQINGLVLYKSIPCMITVAQLMLLNNTCDIERDSQAGRKTLPILLGREKSLMLCKVLTVVWVIQMLQSIITWYRLGTVVILVLLFLSRKAFLGILQGKRTADTKNADIAAVAGAGLTVAVGYPLSILLHLLLG